MEGDPWMGLFVGLGDEIRGWRKGAFAYSSRGAGSAATRFFFLEACFLRGRGHRLENFSFVKYALQEPLTLRFLSQYPQFTNIRRCNRKPQTSIHNFFVSHLVDVELIRTYEMFQKRSHF